MKILGLGIIINTIFVLIGGTIGLFFSKLFNENIRKSLISAVGVCVIFIGLSGALEKILQINNNVLSSNNLIPLIVCMALGTLIGTLLNLEGKVNKLSKLFKNDNSFFDAFLTASCTISIGGMIFIGAIEDGIYHNPSIFITKGIIDCITIGVLTATLGKGAIFSFIPNFIIGFVLTIIASIFGNIVPESSINLISLVGSVIIFAIGLNLIRDKKLPVVNFIPAIFIAGIWGVFLG